jgi:hypothetical protein
MIYHVINRGVGKQKVFFSDEKTINWTCPRFLPVELMLNAKATTPVDIGLIPTGEIRSVKGTPFDFTTAKAIGRDVGQKDQQLEYGLGYDHNWVLDKGGKDGQMTLAATVYEPTSGRFMEVFTEEPGIQFYSSPVCHGVLDSRLHDDGYARVAAKDIALGGSRFRVT